MELLTITMGNRQKQMTTTTNYFAAIIAYHHHRGALQSHRYIQFLVIFFLLKIDDFDEISKSFICFTVTNANKYTGTLGAHTELDGVPFVLNSALSSDDQSTAFDVRIKFK